MKPFLLVAAFILLATITQGYAQNAAPVLRIGFFPNITHAQGLIGYYETQTRGAAAPFETATGAKIEWYPFNAGPSAVEALLAGTIDATYVGPNPVINGYIRSKGREIRVLSGAARGGVALVVHAGSGLRTPNDFRGKKIATPQLGNTQDVAARAWLQNGGLKIKLTGGDAFIIPTPNPDQLDLFKRKELDAVWTVEPWVSRLEMEAGAEPVLVQDNTFITLLATSAKALTAKAPLLRKFVAAHETLTARITAEPDYAKTGITAALKKLTGKEIPSALYDHAWPRLKFTTALEKTDFESAMRDARSVGLLPGEADLTQLFSKP